MEHVYELYGCVDGIQLWFCFEFFFNLASYKLSLCGSVSATLIDPQGVCDCQNMEHCYELHGYVEVIQIRLCFEFFLNLALYKTVSVWQCVSSPQRPPDSMWLSKCGFELHVCVEGIQHRFCSNFSSIWFPSSVSVSAPLRDPRERVEDIQHSFLLEFFQFNFLQNCVGVAPLRDPQWVCECQNKAMNHMAVWTVFRSGLALIFVEFGFLQSCVCMAVCQSPSEISREYVTVRTL